MNDPTRDTTTPPFRLAVVSGGTGDPSTTRMLADRIAAAVTRLAHDRGEAVTTRTIDLRGMAGEISTAVVSQSIGPRLAEAVAILGEADGVIVSAPVYKAAPSGLFSSFFHVLDNDLLIGKPVVLAATAGTARHALVVDDQMRPLFAYLRTLTAPTSVFASSEDWSDGALGRRIERAAIELLLLMQSGFARRLKDEAWNGYQHEYGSAGGTEFDIDLDSDMMRLAAGGGAGGGARA
ncbi:FMN reductase [Stackebrandtia albiflava]|uniref:FMN reductase n=1 Tax=Stackebrandtia albiflava TaxID=406432 RepID=A0A562UQD1_9ACTN|nr:CE1759 family FMN reductase [Stackebrandtia albiflava]TWJ07829.1 FMN reductase [Stackebrandtia albiflava]